jgi:hypothetical protein
MDEDRILVEVAVGKGSTLQVVALDYGGAEDVASLGTLSLDGVIDTIKTWQARSSPPSTPSHQREPPWSSASRWPSRPATHRPPGGGIRPGLPKGDPRLGKLRHPTGPLLLPPRCHQQTSTT